MELAVPTRMQPRDQEKDLLRFITCGSVDDGKSTLIGRLLHDTKLIFEDQLARSSKIGATRARPERHRFCASCSTASKPSANRASRSTSHTVFSRRRGALSSSPTRPGTNNYTRNMATGASNAQLAVILIDARKGVLVQTKRHSFICSLLGIRHVVVAVNKIDLVGFKKDGSIGLSEIIRPSLRSSGFLHVVPIPISARFGDNVIERRRNTPWYRGPSLLDYLEDIDVTR